MKTIIILDRTRYAIHAQCGKTPTDADIWRSIRHKDINRKVCNFLWKGLHQAYKCGTYWRNIPTFEQWAVCPVSCNAAGQELIWNLCRQLWEMKYPKLPELSIGLIFGCGLAEFENSRGKKTAENRLFKIIISGSAFLVRKIRCGSCINNRLKIDQLLTDISRYGSRATNVKTVLKTWDGVLMDKKNLPENWMAVWGFSGYR
ncbi:hypothetical protein B0H14DRAFT_3087790 [Mycena olivaceomarginata]|nr:hypothetical protein B0H14DRAFT_3087790 [Mycena olivaceomarginata]